MGVILWFNPLCTRLAPGLSSCCRHHWLSRALRSCGKLGVPQPVTGSQEGPAQNPCPSTAASRHDRWQPMVTWGVRELSKCTLQSLAAPTECRQAQSQEQGNGESLPCRGGVPATGHSKAGAGEAPARPSPPLDPGQTRGDPFFLHPQIGLVCPAPRLATSPCTEPTAADTSPLSPTHIVEGGTRSLLLQFVERWVQEAQGRQTFLQTAVVDQGHNAPHHRGGGLAGGGKVRQGPGDVRGLIAHGPP